MPRILLSNNPRNIYISPNLIYKYINLQKNYNKKLNKYLIFIIYLNIKKQFKFNIL